MKNLFVLPKKKVLLVPLIAVLCSGQAWAEWLVSPQLYAPVGAAGGRVTCRIFQYSSAASEPILTTAIYTNNPPQEVPVPLNSNSCKATGLARFNTCTFYANITGSKSYACVFNASGGVNVHYTGLIDIIDSRGNVLAREAMRVQ